MERVGSEEIEMTNKYIFKTPCKYRNKKVKYNGIVFDSKKEFERFLGLSSLAASGEIRNLERQVAFELIPKQGKLRATKYVADFCYEKKVGGEWKKIVADVKSDFTRRLPVYVIKKKLMLERHGIEIQEI